MVSTVGVLPASATASAAFVSGVQRPRPPVRRRHPKARHRQPAVPGSSVDFPAGGQSRAASDRPRLARQRSRPTADTWPSAVDDGNGGSRIVVSRATARQRARLIDSPTPVTALTWSSNDRIIYTDGTTIKSVDLSQATSAVHDADPGSGTITALAPGGPYAYVAPASGTGGALLDVHAGTEQVLHGSTADVAFSGDGSDRGVGRRIDRSGASLDAVGDPERAQRRFRCPIPPPRPSDIPSIRRR